MVQKLIKVKELQEIPSPKGAGKNVTKVVLCWILQLLCIYLPNKTVFELLLAGASKLYLKGPGMKKLFYFNSDAKLQKWLV